MLLAFSLASCAAPSTSGWEMEKLGSWVDSRDIVSTGGAAHLHAAGDAGARRICASAAAATTVGVVALDSALFSVGRNTAFPTPLRPLSTSEANGGIFAILGDNYWNTNYPLTIPFGKYARAEQQERFRFAVTWPGVATA